MAEEIQDASDDVGTKSLIEANLSLPGVSSFGEDLPAKPLAMNAYYDVVGNPVTGGNPKKQEAFKGTEDVIKGLEAELNAPPKANPYYAMQPYTYSNDYDAANFERYYSTGDIYDKVGFSPYRNNEALYNQKMSLGDDFVRASKQWDDLVGIGFMSGVRSWKTLFTDPLAPDLEGAEGMKKAMAIGSSSKGGVGGFFVNTFLNSAYTVGVGLDFLAEEIALAGVTAATGAAGGGAMLGKGISSINKLFDFGKAAEKIDAGADVLNAERIITHTEGLKQMGNSIPEARNFWTSIGRGAKTVTGEVADILNPLDQTIAALKATDYATDYAKTVKTFGAFADDLLMVKGAVSEAKLEGGMVKLDLTEQLIDKYREEYGKNPEGEDLKRIENIATQKALTTALWNLPAITTSNKLMYATMLAPMRKLMGRATAELIPEIILQKGVYKVVGEGVVERAGVAAKSLTQPKYYGKFGMNYLKANLAEGVQENLQEAISAGAIAHGNALYDDPIRANYEGYMGHFMKGLKAQFSAQGAETFAGGFVMGMFAQPVMSIPSIGISKLVNGTINKEAYEKLKEDRRKELEGYDVKDEQGNVTEHVKGTVEFLNEFINDGNGNVNLDHIAPDIGNSVVTGRLANDFYSAAKAGKRKEAEDAKGALQNQHLMTAIRTGKLDQILDRLQDYKNFSKEEATQAFAKYGIAPEDVDKALAQIDNVVARAKSIKEDYEDSANNYPNPFNPNKYRKDPARYLAALASKQAWDEAVFNLVFAKSTFKDYSKRVADVANTFSKISSDFAREDAQSMMSLLSSKAAMAEINTLRREISVLDETNGEQKKVKKDKQNRLEKLNTFYDSIASLKFATTEEEKASAHTASREAFAEYVKYLAKKNDNIVFDESLNQAYTLIKDHMLLKDDMAGLSKSINVLMAPESFVAIQERIAKGMLEGFQNKADIISKNHEVFKFTKDFNDITNTIGALGLALPAEFISEFMDAHNNNTAYPELMYFLDKNDEKVIKGDKYDEAVRQWNIFIDVVGKKPKGTTTERDTFVAEDFSTYPQGLKDFLQPGYDNLAEDIKDQVSFEDYATDIAREYARNKYFELQEEEALAIPKEYAGLTVDQLNEKKDQLTKDAESNPSLEPKIRQLEDIIAYRLMNAALEAGTITPEARLALLKLKDLTDTAQNIDKDDEGYIINGQHIDYRVTQLVYENILSKDPYNVAKTDFAEGLGKTLMEIAKPIFAQGRVEGFSSAKIIDEWVNKVKGFEQFKDRFDTAKIEGLKKELKDKATYEEFKKLITKYAYKESSTAGNTIDKAVRHFFSGKLMVKPEGMSTEAFEGLRKGLHELMDVIKSRGEVVLAKNLIVSGMINVNGEQKTIAGEMDLVVVTPKGEIKIYDVKSGKTGKNGKLGTWDKFGTDQDFYKKKEGYAVQLSLYKRLLENATGLKVTDLRIVPFEIDINLDGHVNKAQMKVDTKSADPKVVADNIKNSVIEFQPIVDEYITLNTKGAAAQTAPAPFVEVVNTTAQPAKPVRPELTPAQAKSRTANINFINKKIAGLNEKLSLQRQDIGSIDDTLAYLEDLLNNTVDLTDGSLKQIQNQIDLLLETIKSSSAIKTSRGLRTLDTIADLKKSYRSEFQLLNDITDRIKDLKNDLKQMQAIESDLTNQINYYNNLIADPTLTTLDKDNLEKRRAKIQSKITVLDKLISNIKKAIQASIKYLRTAVDMLLSSDSNLKNFVTKTGYQTLSSKEINALMNSDLESDTLFLESYPALKDRFQQLENSMLQNLDTVEFLEDTKTKEEERINALQEAVEKYQDQIRYLDELMVSQGKILKEKIPGVNVTKNGILSFETTTKAVPVTSKTAVPQPVVENTIKEEKKKLKEVEGEVVAKLTFDTAITEDAKDISLGKLEFNTPIEVTPEDLNKEINLESLKLARKNKFNILYNGIQYKIKRIGTKSVTLTSPNKMDENIKLENFSELMVIPGGGLKTSSKTNEIIKNNEQVITSTERAISDKPVQELKTNFLKNLKKC